MVSNKSPTKEMAYWETKEKMQTHLSLVNSEVVGLFPSFDPEGTNKSKCIEELELTI
jgi:hypothetical protein